MLLVPCFYYLVQFAKNDFKLTTKSESVNLDNIKEQITVFENASKNNYYFYI